jgi:hypothetical protein
VSWLHRHSPLGIWRREMLRAVVWGALLPVSIGVGALFHPVVLLGASVYLLQFCRMAVREGPSSRLSWSRALLLTLAHFAAFQGILRFLSNKWRQDPATLIEYK